MFVRSDPDGSRARSTPDEFGFFAVIGDIVRSRDTDRPYVQSRLTAALAEVNRRVGPIQPLTITIGDEFQALYADLDAALQATFLAKLLLREMDDVRETADTRFGIGWGALSAFDSERMPLGQDGPAWWAARLAIDTVKKYEQQRSVPNSWRTRFALNRFRASLPLSDGEQLQFEGLESVVPPPSRLLIDESDIINGLLLLRDELANRLDARECRRLLSLMSGSRQEDVAMAEGITQAAVSQWLRRSGADALLYLHRTLVSRTTATKGDAT